MPRKHQITNTRNTLLSLAIGGIFVPTLALAGTGTPTLGVGYDNVGVNAGGIHSTLPAAKISGLTTYPDGYAWGFGLALGSGNGLTYQHLAATVEKALPFDGGTITPEITAGVTRVGIGYGQHLRAAYAGFGAGYAYPLGRDVLVGVSGGVGRDFATSVPGIPTVGGLYYQASADVAFRGIGPGSLEIGYQYRHLPLTTSHGINLNTGEVFGQYKITL
ncbi:hypothetical protein [Acidithiobacillus caldus]|uniref:hypothetical protein n=1 Tax=Acidithiobacillus caldus TaxID=33059 RepID=UPI001C0727FB|nr:hypothetical protein [Acidithiobacillus caldus]MBU2770113.1 hypothetical protein [Acidithiobacillus caldus]